MAVTKIGVLHPAELVRPFLESPPSNLIIIWVDGDGEFHTESKTDDILTALGMLELAKDTFKYDE